MCNIFDLDVFFLLLFFFNFDFSSNFLNSILAHLDFCFGSVPKRDTFCLFSSLGGKIVPGLHSFTCHLSRLHYWQILFDEWFGQHI